MWGRAGAATAFAALAVLTVPTAAPAVSSPPDAEPVLRFEDRAITEASGLVDLGGSVLTVNDSGDEARLFVVDKADGRTLGTLTYTSDPVVDVEALAPGPDGEVWVGDIGDNRRQRQVVSVYRVPRLDPSARVLETERFDLAYADGPRDAEALLVSPLDGRMYVVSKGVLSGEVYQAPARLRSDRVNVLRPVARVAGLVTDGAFLPGGQRVVLRDYSRATIHQVPGFVQSGTFALPDQPQGEALAATPSGTSVLTASEGRRTRVFEVALPSPRPAGSDGGTTPPDDGGPPWATWGLVALVLLAVGGGVRAALRRPGRR